MGKIHFYPLDAAVRTLNQRTAAVLYGRTISGDRICVVDTAFLPYFYIHPKIHDTAQLEKELSQFSIKVKEQLCSILKIEKKQMKINEKETSVLKVFTNNSFGIYYLVQELKKHKDISNIYESDVPFIQSYLLDRRIVPGFLTEVEGEFISKHAKMLTFSANSVSQPFDEVISPKILAFDLETYSPKGKSSSPEHDPIMMVSFYSENFKKTITWKKFHTEDHSIEFVDSEFDLLNKFKRTIEEFKPDYLVGYTSDLFLFPYLKKRADKYNLIFDLGVDKSEADIGKDETYIKGLVHIDLYKFISKIISSKLESDTYRLKEVAKELIGESKKTIDVERFTDIWDNEPGQLAPYCEYNLHNAYLVYKLALKTFTAVNELIKLTNMLPYGVVRGNFSQYAEAFLIKESKFSNEIIPRRPSSADYESRKPLAVDDALIEAAPGIYNNIFVYDFTLLYPSIIATHNISPGVMNCWCCDEKVPNEKMHFCRKVTGFFTKIASAMLDRRRRITKMLTDEVEKTPEQAEILSARADVLTSLARSLYGVFSFPSSRWYNEECNKAMQAYGRHYMGLIITKAEKEGFKTLYADFDSVFLRKGNHSIKSSQSLYETVVASLPEKMELNHEGIYPRAMFVSSKLGKNMKRYALLSQQGFLKMVGFDTVRRNLSTMAKEAQEKVLYHLLKDKSASAAVSYVRRLIDDVKNQRIPLRRAMIYTQLQKDISKYETIAPHVAVAKHMQQQGFTVTPGLIIRYIVGPGAGSIAERSHLPNEVDSYDSDYYVSNQIIPAVDKIFEAAGIDFMKALAEKEQISLKEFI